ncbi:MAG: double-strand break repair protein AddB [Albidovulum sp.]
MFDPSTKPRIFAQPPGVDFPRALARGLVARMANQPPEAMARVTVYLNTARMQARVREAFQELGAGFLPRLRLVTDLGHDALAGMPAAVPPLRRRLELARLVGGLVAHQGDFAPGTAVFDLADSLAGLMAEMQSEGVAPEAFEAPGFADDHAAHWERSLTFLRIVARFFDADAAPDAEGRQRRVVEALIQGWQKQAPADPVIVAGSTGSRGATALLMQAVAGLPQGALVLPGFDFDLPDLAWNSLYSGVIPDEDHPQFRYVRLLGALDLLPGDVGLWDAAPAPDGPRNRLVSLALRPAPVTDQWLSDGAELRPLGPATHGLTLIEAPTPRAEAMAIALLLRRAAEEGQSTALISPDRVLARRVVAALDRWGLRPDDSAGRPLHLTAPGRFLRHIAALFGQRPTGEALLVLLKHPLTATGDDDMRGNHLRFARDLELRLRRHGPPFPTGDDLRDWAKDKPDRHIWAEWLAGWLEALPSAASGPLLAYTETLLAMAEALAAGPGGQPEASELWREEAGRAAHAALSTLRGDAVHGGDFTAGGFADLLTSVLQKETVRDSDAVHPLIAIQGTREAREVQADLVIMAGLNEGTWPEAASPDPWLSRQMRLKAGLLLPERQIGLAAHDFQQAIAAGRVILTRAIRDDEAQTVPSRWLDRLTNLLRGLDGETGVLAGMKARGQVWLDLVQAFEAVSPVDAAPRPSPRPPVASRPTELPVTAIRTLIRDPYAVYARHILRLRPLDPLAPEPDPRLRGTALHKIVEKFVASRPEAEDLPAARARLMAVAEAVLVQEVPWPSAQRLWLARIARIAARFVEAEEMRARLGTPVVLESGGKIRLDEVDFTLTARPDRIDQLADGSVHIYDYKSGKPPTKDQQKHFDKQLLLEAAMAERGAFAKVGPQMVHAVSYIQLGGDGVEVTTSQDEGDFSGHWAGLLRLIRHYFDAENGYTSRRALFEAGRVEDYDHLARFGEWQMSDAPSPEDVG